MVYFFPAFIALLCSLLLMSIPNPAPVAMIVIAGTCKMTVFADPKKEPQIEGPCQFQRDAAGNPQIMFDVPTKESK